MQRKAAWEAERARLEAARDEARRRKNAARDAHTAGNMPKAEYWALMNDNTAVEALRAHMALEPTATNGL
jgi:hypothetical protein